MTTESTKLPSLLQELALILELQPPSVEKKHVIRMMFSPIHTIEFRELPTGFSIWSNIGACPHKNKEDFYLFIMRANFLGQGTGNSVIGMDLEEKYLTLSSYIPYEVDFRKFKEIVEEFLNFVDYWKEELARHIAQADETFIT